MAQAVLEGRTLSLSGRQLDDTKRWQTDKAALMQAQNEAIRDCAMARRCASHVVYQLTVISSLFRCCVCCASVVVVPLLRHNEAFGALLLVDRQDTSVLVLQLCFVLLLIIMIQTVIVVLLHSIKTIKLWLN